MSRVSWEHKAQKLVGRHWGELAYNWAGHVPELPAPGVSPDAEVCYIEALALKLRDFPPSNRLDITEDIPSLRAAVLHHGIFDLHKAVNVLSGAQVHIRNGLRSWSVSSSYHAAFFAAKAILHMLGISIFQHEDEGNFLVDVWSTRQRPKQGEKVPLRPTRETLLLRIPRPEHRYVWGYLQKILAKTVFEDAILSPENGEAIGHLTITDFGRQRNDLHYRPTWLFDDLHDFVVDPNYGLFVDHLLDGGAISNPENDNFSIALAFVLVRMAFAMLSELRDLAPALQGEIDMLEYMLEHPHNYLYGRACLA